MLLALDTATRQAGLALYDGEAVRAQVTWHSGVHHTEWLAPAVYDSLRRINATVADLTAVGVTIGPGSFTGLRVALSLAKGMAAARDLPIIGISTLDVTAYPHVGSGARVCATLQAGRGRHAYAFYGAAGEREQLEATEPAIADVKGLVEAIRAFDEEGVVRVAGELTPAEYRYLAEQVADRVDLLSPALSVRSPAVLAELAWSRFEMDDVDTLHTLEPLYLQLSPKQSGTG